MTSSRSASPPHNLPTMAEASKEQEAGADDQTLGAVVGVKVLLLSQMSSRLLTFFLNLAVARLLTPEEYGMVSIQFHLINTTILMLSREGFRRGCLVAAGTTKQRDSGQSSTCSRPAVVPEAAIMPIAVLVIPCGVLVTVAIALLTAAFSEQHTPEQVTLVGIQSLAALIELLGEPLYIVAQARLMFRLRVTVEGFSQVAKAVVTLALLAYLGGHSAGLAISLAQLAYGSCATAAYTWAFRAELLPMAGAAARWRSAPVGGEVQEQHDRSHLVRMCGGFSLQAVEKLVLAEGSKLVMAAVESSYNQGVYGMVSNLGSLVVRLVFQPLEEGAFTAFVAGSKSFRNTATQSSSTDRSAPGAAAARLASVAHGMMKVAALVGLVIASFGPAYSYTALRLVYGRRWSESEAPTALGAYAMYVALLAVNGVSEAFTHAVGSEKQLHMANAALVVFGVTHMLLSFILCQV